MSLVVKETAAPTTTREVLTRGLWAQNPVLVQTLGLCSALAVTNAVAQSIAMGLATTFVLVCSSVIVSTIRRSIPNEIRISAFILIIATFVAIADLGLEAIAPAVHAAMGPYLALVVTNCIVLGRQEAFASRQPVGKSVLDALGNGVGFSIALLLMGIPRELLGSGTLLGYRVMPAAFEPWVIMVLPPGGFFMIGCLLVIANWRAARRALARPVAEATPITRSVRLPAEELGEAVA